MRGAAAIVAGVGLLCGCGERPQISSPHGKLGYGPLRHVVLLPLTTRSSDGLLGHALHVDGATPDQGRQVLGGTPRQAETSQDVTVVRELGEEAAIAADYGPAAAEIQSGQVTHLAYVVHIDAYLELGEDADYRAESDCCFNGKAQARCRGGYVERLVRGSGSVKYLREASREARLSAAQVFETRGGERFRVLDEYAFDDAYFGFEAGDMAQLCSTLPDAASFQPIQVRASPNCSVMAYDLSGNGEHLSKYLPDEETCRTVGYNFCQSVAHCVRCVGSFSVDGEPRTFALDVTPSAEVGKARTRASGAAPQVSPAAAGDAAPPPVSPTASGDAAPPPAMPTAAAEAPPPPAEPLKAP